MRTHRSLAVFVASIIVSICALGCQTQRPPQPPVAALDPATTQPAHWLDQPGPNLSAEDFDAAWAACEDVARELFFTIDRTDYRAGVLTTDPMVSMQWFEFWRGDVQTSDDLADSSLANTRRTARFEFTRNDNGTFAVKPIVLVERQVIAEQRITSVVSYRAAFRPPPKPSERPRGTRESDEGVLLPGRYWYPTGRDAALEKVLADRISKRLAVDSSKHK